MSLQYLSRTSPRQVAHQLSDMGIQQSVADLFIFAKSGYSTSRKWQSQDLHLGSWPRAELLLALLGMPGSSRCPQGLWGLKGRLQRLLVLLFLFCFI